MTDDTTKHCRGCDRTLSLREFPPRRSTSVNGGYRPRRASRCRECCNKAAAAWRAAHPGAQAASTRAWKERFATEAGLSYGAHHYRSRRATCGDE